MVSIHSNSISVKHSIATLLLRKVFLLYFIIAVLISSAYLGFLYYETKVSIEQQLQTYEKTFAKGFTLHVWNMEKLETQALIEGMLQLPYVIGITISQEETGQVFAHTGQFLDKKKSSQSSALFSHSFKLYYQRSDETFRLGEVHIYSSLHFIWQALKLDYLLVIASAIIKTIALWFIFLYYSQHYLQYPLEQLTQATSQVNFNHLEPIKIDLSNHKQDELYLLKQQFNVMLDKLRLAYSKLEFINISLEQKVKQRTQELLNAKQKAESASQAKSHFLAKVSHEFKTPLHAILGFTSLLQQNHTNTEQLEKLATIQKNAQFLLRLINDLLDMTQIEKGKFSLQTQAMDLGHLLHTIQQTMYSLSQDKGLTLIMQYPKDLPCGLILDATRLEQIISNLLMNAIKFTQYGQVQLIVSYHWLNQNHSLIKLNIEVTDTGNGIIESKQDSIFQAFEQLDQSHSRQSDGMGLGLAISQQLAQLMGGLIALKSQLGKGSQFQLILPEVTVTDSSPCLGLKKNKHYPLNQIKSKLITPIPDKELLESLIPLAQLGLTSKIEQWVVTLDNDYHAFGQEVLKLAHRFNRKELLIFVDKHIDTNK